MADVLDKTGMVRTFHQRNYLLLCFRVVGNILYVRSQVRTGVRQLLLMLEILVKVFNHTFKIRTVCQWFEEKSERVRVVERLEILIYVFEFTELVFGAEVENTVLQGSGFLKILVRNIFLDRGFLPQTWLIFFDELYRVRIFR